MTTENGLGWEAYGEQALAFFNQFVDAYWKGVFAAVELLAAGVAETMDVAARASAEHLAHAGLHQPLLVDA